MADWDEIKRLAADFQQAQTNDTLQRISERNCIDIVKKLTELSLIELIYTCDGKEFITPSHLLKEIEDEIYVNGGRMHLHDLATNLNVDYQHIENRAKELTKDNPVDYSLVLGQIIHTTYKNTLIKQINDCMLSIGQLSIADFAKSLDLPSEFLLSIVKELLPKVMDDFVVSHDERTYYTTDMMDKYRSMIAGTLSAISKPTSIASLMKRLDIPERIFVPIVDGLIKDGRIDASMENRIFTPSVYARGQNDWINKFYGSNHYIEYDVVSRMNIKQPKAFLKKKFPDGIQLKTCFISPNLSSQVETMIEECLASKGWIDISTILPSAIEPQDIEQLLNDIFKSNKQFESSCIRFDQTIVCSIGYIVTCKNSFISLMQSKAKEDLSQGKLMNYFLGGELKKSASKEDQVKKELISEDTEEPNSGTKPKVDRADEGKSEVFALDESQESTKERKDHSKSKKAKNVIDFEDSDEEQSHKKTKSRKSGGGTQGREMKQKAVKKKYIPSNKANLKGNDMSDDETGHFKTPRSNKGRASRRNVSPEPPQKVVKSKNAQSKTNSSQKEPLIFMSFEEITNKLISDSRGLGESVDEFAQSIAREIQDELNMTYENLARQTLDEFLKSQDESDDEEQTSQLLG